MTTLSDQVQDPKRLAALRRTALLDSPSEEAFDRLTRLATKFLHAPVALVSLIDTDRQFFKSCIGLPEPALSARQTPLSHSFCQHTIHTGKPVIIPDARRHPLVRNNPAIQDLGVEAYAGFPLITSDNHVLGSFCVIDTHPREWALEEYEALQDLAALVMTEIEMRTALRVAQDLSAQADLLSREKSALLEATSEGLYGMNTDGLCSYINQAGAKMLGYATEELIGKDMHTLIHHSRRDGSAYPLAQCPIYSSFHKQRRCHVDGEVFWRRDGKSVAVEYRAAPILKDGEVVGGVVSFADVTARKEREMLRQDLANALMEDLRAPLTSLNGSLQKLKSSALPAQKEGFEQATHDVGTLLEKMNDLHSLSPSR